MFDTDKFIECVHGKPALWHKSLAIYSDRTERDRSWTDIGELMYENWTQLDAKTKDLRVKEMKNKWRHIRDNFMKGMNQYSSGAPAAKKKKPYVYADSLTFLLNTIEKRPTSGNLDDIGGLDEEQVEEREEEDEEEEEEERQTDDGVAHQDDVQQEVQPPGQQPAGPQAAGPQAAGPQRARLQTAGPQPAGRKRRAAKMTAFQTKLLTELGTAKNKEDDPDRLFLLSMLSDYKSLNPDQKLDFKMMNLQFFRNARQRTAPQGTPPAPLGPPLGPPLVAAQMPQWNMPAPSYQQQHIRPYCNPPPYPLTPPRQPMPYQRPWLQDNQDFVQQCSPNSRPLSNHSSVSSRRQHIKFVVGIIT